MMCNIKRLKNVWGTALLFTLIPILFSCEEQGPEYVEDYDLVVTTHDAKFKFAEPTYYEIPDTIVHIVPESSIKDPISHKYDDRTISLIKEELNSLGYLEANETNGATPQLMLTVSAMSTTYVGAISYDWYDYWGWYGWGSYYPWFGPGYSPWYPYYNSYYAYKIGSVIIQMIDMENADTKNKKLPIVWEANISGLLQGSDSYIQSRIEKNIPQAFDQSTYLGK
ncbi:DUF4136 domain-containing protein [Halosquirtibacter xylanolyticus]|uniref:DUF4136 domain-containing protein n=1 Tax=Halosquirtibacter xylanolyticus TaxID=3374599 RepID=UPI003748E662|nr:DUF4136 domain-containing protein [Prolixibacteraceae bacterium]